MRALAYAAVAAAIVAAACRSERPQAAREPPPGAPAAVSPAGDARVAPRSAAAWVVSPAGAGPVRVGMSLAELMPYLAPGADTASIGDGCDYVSVAGAPDGLGFMVEGRRLVRVEVRSGPTPTAEGARVGDSEQHILQLYPDARRMPHKYTDGHYLIALPDAPADTVSRYVFETDGSRVTTYRAGEYPPVEYVEGCS